MALPVALQSLNDDLNSNQFLGCDPVFVHENDENDGYRALVESLKTESPPWKRLCEAISHGDEPTIFKECQSISGPPSCVAKTQAVLSGRIDVLKLLLDRDSTIDENTVVAACERKDRDSIRMLVNYGWDINKPLCCVASLLCIAVDDVNFVKSLLELGADVNARSDLDEPALSIAVVQGSIEVVRLLLDAGTDVLHGNVVHCAAKRQNQYEGAELVKEPVMRGVDVDGYCYNNSIALRWRGMSNLETALHTACRKGNLPVARVLLQQSADPCRRVLVAGEQIGPTPLDDAAEIGNQDLIDLLQVHSSRARASELTNEEST